LLDGLAILKYGVMGAPEIVQKPYGGAQVPPVFRAFITLLINGNGLKILAGPEQRITLPA
jgi:hypothetical protein